MIPEGRKVPAPNKAFEVRELKLSFVEVLFELSAPRTLPELLPVELLLDAPEVLVELFVVVALLPAGATYPLIVKKDAFEYPPFGSGLNTVMYLPAEPVMSVPRREIKR